jgi:protein RecA
MSELEKALKKIVGENDSNQDVSDYLSSGLLNLNKAISGYYRGGFPVGRISEIYGGESSGKTLMATMAMIETQKKGGIAVMLDFEHAFSVSRAEELGLNTDQGWIYKQPETAESGFVWLKEICEKIREHKDNTHITFVIDSIAAMTTVAELEAGFDGGNMKTRLSLPTLMSTSCKLLAGIISNTNATLIFLNQTRDNPGVMFGDKETQPGGKAMKFYASLRIRLGKRKKIKGEADQIIGEEIVAKTIKNKVYRPFIDTEYHSNFETGIDLETSHINAAILDGLLKKTGAHVEWKGKKHYVKALATAMRKDPAQYEALLAHFKD